MTELNHVGITVGDIDTAITWYTEVFGLKLLLGPIYCDTTTPGAQRRQDIFGPKWGAMKLAHLGTRNGAGIELFEFVEPATQPREENFTYWLTGPHHVAVTVADIHDTLARLVAKGGRQRSGVFDVEGRAYVCYCEDPWGNVLELATASYRELIGAPAS